MSPEPRQFLDRNVVCHVLKKDEHGKAGVRTSTNLSMPEAIQQDSILKDKETVLREESPGFPGIPSQLPNTCL